MFLLSFFTEIIYSIANLESRYARGKQGKKIKSSSVALDQQRNRPHVWSEKFKSSEKDR